MEIYKENTVNRPWGSIKYKTHKIPKHVTLQIYDQPIRNTCILYVVMQRVIEPSDAY